MATSILSLVQSAARRTGLPIPATLVTTPKDYELQYLENFYSVCEDLLSRGAWPCLKRVHTFTTTNTEEYALPTDFWSWCASSAWDTTNAWPLRGPLTDKRYNEEKYWYGPSSTRTHFRIFGSKDMGTKKPIKMWPIATGLDMSLDYISRQFLYDATGANVKDAITVDTDICLFPDIVLKAGWRFFWLDKKGQDTIQAKSFYEKTIDRAMFKDVGPAISSRSPHGDEENWFNTEEGSWNV